MGPKKVRILMTGLGFTSDSPEYIVRNSSHPSQTINLTSNCAQEWASKLAKFGAKFTEEPKEATHLVVKVRLSGAGLMSSKTDGARWTEHKPHGEIPVQ